MIIKGLVLNFQFWAAVGFICTPYFGMYENSKEIICYSKGELNSITFLGFFAILALVCIDK